MKNRKKADEMILKRIIFSGVLSTVLLNANVLCMDHHRDSLTPNPHPYSPAIKCTESGATVTVEDSKLFSELAPTLAIMKMFLKEKFKPLPTGLRDNVVAFFGSSEFTPPHNCFHAEDQKIILDDELTNILCQLILLEQKEALKGNVTFWHGLQGELLFTYKYYAYLFSRLSGQDVGPFVLRGDHFYAKNPKTGERFKTLREIREAYKVNEGDESRGTRDYGQWINISIMHCNIALSAGPGTSRSSASSVGFMCQSYSASEQSIFNIVYPTLVFQGMPLIDARRSAKEVEELFTKTFLAGHENNGGILGISLPKNLADELALHVQMGGKEYDPSVWSLIKDVKAVFKEESLENWKVNALYNTITSQKVGVSTSEIAHQIGSSIFFNEGKVVELGKLLESYFSSRSSKDSSISNLLGSIQTAMLQNLSKDEICNLTNEIALYINPEIQPIIFGTFRHPLNSEQEALFDKELRALVDSHVALIAASETKPLENSFLVKRSKEMVPVADAQYQIGAIPFLIERGLITEAQEIIRSFPDLGKNEEVIRLLVGKALSALQEGVNGILESIEKVFGRSFFTFIHPDHLPLILREYGGCGYTVELLNCLITRGIKLDDKLFADLLVSVRHSKCCLEKVLEKKKVSQEILEDIIFRNTDVPIFVDTIIYFMQYGFSFNPNEAIGQKHLETWLEICKKDRSLASSIADIIDFYKLPPSDYMNLYTFLANQGVSYYSMGDKCLGSCTATSDGYMVKVGDFKTNISFDRAVSIPSFNISINTYFGNYSAVSKFLSEKFGRQYTAALIKAFCELKSSYYPYTNYDVNISLEIPENHTWLPAFKEAETLSEAEKLVYELDNLDILLLNLKLLDENPEVKRIISDEVAAHDTLSGKVTSEKGKATKREAFVNEWFVGIAGKYKKQYSEIAPQLTEWASLSPEKQTGIRESIIKAPLSSASKFVEHFPQLGSSVRLPVLSRIWNFDTSKFIPDQYDYAQFSELEGAFITNFFESEVELHPGILNNPKLVYQLFEKNTVPQSILRDMEKMTGVFLKLSPQQQYWLISEMFGSSNRELHDFAREIINRILYPGTKILARDAITILKSYGILEGGFGE